ncbi:O52I1 protein, partial [Bucco capensis]|nr:O52I1 protein [Bucco capensis]
QPNSSSSSFFLLGIPGLEAFSSSLGILLCSGYVVGLLGNGLVLLVLGQARGLREPVHCLLAMLALLDLLMLTCVLPKLLAVLWLGWQEIGQGACFLQMFLVHCSTCQQSGVLVAMALDRYLAVCHPLRHRAILSSPVLARLGLAIVLRGVLLVVPLAGMLSRLPYCHSRLLPHSYCEHLAVLQLACADPRPWGLYSLACSSLVVGMDLALIALSYGMILRAILGKGCCWKASSTCGCHLSVVLLYYIPGLLSIYCQYFSSRVSTRAQVLLADLYLILPSVLNPIIYSLRSRQIQQAMLSLI